MNRQKHCFMHLAVGYLPHWRCHYISQWKPNKINTNTAHRLTYSADLQISDIDVAIAFLK